MDLFFDGLAEAARMVARGDPQVFEAARRTLWVSLCAVTAAATFALPLGTLVATTRFPFRGTLILVARAGMAVPTVFVGIICYGLFSRSGPLGGLALLYSPWAIVAGEFLLAFPIIFAMTQGAVSALDSRVSETARTLGAGFFQRWLTYVSEARTGVLLGVLTALARCMTELGIAILVGGNILHRTRTLATATALETGRGEFARGLAMGFILLAMSLGVTSALVILSRETKRAETR